MNWLSLIPERIFSEADPDFHWKMDMLRREKFTGIRSIKYSIIILEVLMGGMNERGIPIAVAITSGATFYLVQHTTIGSVTDPHTQARVQFKEVFKRETIGKIHNQSVLILRRGKKGSLNSKPVLVVQRGTNGYVDSLAFCGRITNLKYSVQRQKRRIAV